MQANNSYNNNNLTAAPPPQLSDSSRPIVGSNNVSPKRVYQAWKGNNRFFFGGRLIFGPDVRSLFLTIFLIVIPAVLFCAFVSQMLINDCKHHLCKLVPAVSTIFTAYIIILLFLTSGRDPGIIPRNTHPPEPEDEVDTSFFPSDWVANQGTAPSILPTKDVVVNGMVVKVKYCHTCMLYRPPRCSHCSICNNCVERFDHHCPWVGQCIGKRNYRFFFMFVASTTIFCLYVFALCWLNVSNIMEACHCNMWKALRKSPVSGILIVYSFIGAWFVGGLTAFHIYLICINQTTYENFRYRYDKKTNPHNVGLMRNVREVLFSKTPSSKNKFRAKLEYSCVVLTTSISMGGMSPEMSGGKRQTVVAEEYEDMQNQIVSLERGGPPQQQQPRHSNNWDHHKQPQQGNWEVTPNIRALAAEFGIEHD